MLLEALVHAINLKTNPAWIDGIMHRYIRHLFIVIMLIFCCSSPAGKMNRETSAKASHHHSVTTVASGQKHYDFYLDSTEECAFELSYEQHLAYALWLCGLGLLLSIAFFFMAKKAWDSFYDFQNKYLSNRIPDRYILYHSFRLYC